MTPPPTSLTLCLSAGSAAVAGPGIASGTEWFGIGRDLRQGARARRETVTRASEGAASPVEHELVTRAQGGDGEAFEALVRAHIGRARAIARRLMGDPDDADDLVQEAFLRALERLGTVDPARPFGPWFFRLLVNAGHDMHRRRKVRRTEPERADVAAPEPNPLQAAEHGEIRRRFEAALQDLPPRQRAIVWSFEVDGMTTEEIAAELGVAQVTVRWHLHQGRRALRAALADLR